MVTLTQRFYHFFPLQKGEEIELIESLYHFGVLDRKLVDKVNSCGNCSAYNINIREVCVSCSDLDIADEYVLHHFRCGHIGLESEFKSSEESDKLICPKCSKELKHIGLDYEKPQSNFLCRSCDSNFNEPIFNFVCLKCNHIDDVNNLEKTNIYSYNLTEKAEEVIKHGSLQHDEFVGKHSNIYPACVTPAYFKMLMSSYYTGVAEYEDNMFLSIIEIPGADSDTLNKATKYLSEMSKFVDALTVTACNKIAYLTPRCTSDYTVGNIRHLQDEMSSLSIKALVRKFCIVSHDFDKFFNRTIEKYSDPSCLEGIRV